MFVVRYRGKVPACRCVHESNASRPAPGLGRAGCWSHLPRSRRRPKPARRRDDSFKRRCRFAVGLPAPRSRRHLRAVGAGTGESRANRPDRAAADVRRARRPMGSGALRSVSEIAVAGGLRSAELSSRGVAAACGAARRARCGGPAHRPRYARSWNFSATGDDKLRGCRVPSEPTGSGTFCARWRVITPGSLSGCP
jgi:hypothetical protein